MSKPNHVPKFGNWDTNDQLPFTVVFEKARADKVTTGNKIINPNDPSANPAAFGIRTDGPPPSRRTSQQYADKVTTGNKIINPNDPSAAFGIRTDGPPPSRRTSQQYADKVTIGNKIMNPNDPSANLAAFGIRTDGPPPSWRTSQQYADELRIRVDSGRGRLHVNGGPLRPTTSARDSKGVGFGEAHNQSAEQSPSHSPSAFKGRLGSRPVSSSLGPEKKGPPEGGTPARTRRPSSRGEETPDRSSALPRFGAWDEKDPSSGEAFTVIFSHARNEKKVGAPVRIPTLESESPTKVDYGDAYKPQHFPLQRKASSWVCCFQARDAV